MLSGQWKQYSESITFDWNSSYLFDCNIGGKLYVVSIPQRSNHFRLKQVYLSDGKLGQEMWKGPFILSWHEIGFVHHFGHIYEIWCLDMIDGKWYPSKKKIPSCILSVEPKYFASTSGRYCYYYRHHKFKKYSKCVKIDLLDVAPLELQKKINKRVAVKNGKICFGYCRQYDIEWKSNFPDDLKVIVLNYYEIMTLID